MTETKLQCGCVFVDGISKKYKVRNCDKCKQQENTLQDKNVIEIMEQTPKEKQFDEQVSKILSRINLLLVQKGKEYRRNNNPFHNFEEGAKISGQTPERVLNGFLLKHFISYQDILNDLDKGILPKQEIIDEKFTDILVYFTIQNIMLLERIKKEL